MPRFGSGPTNSKQRDKEGTSTSAGTGIINNGAADVTWTAPLWLTKDKNHRARNLTIPIPPVPPATRKAIQKHIAKQQPPYFKQQAQMNHFTAKLLHQQEKVKHAQHRLERLEEDKAERIQEIKVIREEEMEESLQKIQQDMQKEHDEAQKQKEEDWKRETEREMHLAKKHFKKERAAEEEKERALYKEKLEEAQQQKKRESEQQQQQQQQDENTTTILKASQKLQEDHAKVQAKLDNLKETKKEMVWLLKQVINAENKRKAAETAIPKKKLKH